MNRKAMKHAFALGLAAMVALGAAGVASAKTRAKDYVGVWQLENQNGNGWGQGQDQGWNGGDRGRNGGDRGWNSGDQGWKGGDQGWNGGDRGNDRGRGRQDGYGRQGSQYGPRGGFLGARLPATFRIERDRRDFRIESMNGSLIRQVDVGWNRQLTSEQTLFGANIVETYSLVDNGHRLMVHTTIHGPQGTRETTSVYDRA